MREGFSATYLHARRRLGSNSAISPDLIGTGCFARACETGAQPNSVTPITSDSSKRTSLAEPEYRTHSIGLHQPTSTKDPLLAPRSRRSTWTGSLRRERSSLRRTRRRRFGIYYNWYAPREFKLFFKETTLARHLKQFGATGLVGKWHLIGNRSSAALTIWHR